MGKPLNVVNKRPWPMTFPDVCHVTSLYFLYGPIFIIQRFDCFFVSFEAEVYFRLGYQSQYMKHI